MIRANGSRNVIAWNFKVLRVLKIDALIENEASFTAIEIINGGVGRWAPPLSGLEASFNSDIGFQQQSQKVSLILKINRSGIMFEIRKEIDWSSFTFTLFENFLHCLAHNLPKFVWRWRWGWEWNIRVDIIESMSSDEVLRYRAVHVIERNRSRL